MQTELFKVTGMTCGACVINVESALKATNGVNDAEVSLETGEARVQYDETQTSADQLKSAVRHAGFGVSPN
ncbi:MAG TPA: heavy metal-associated domain-containing protein [Methylophilaceae bacterium]|nr:heavy metal-associated domain-containing protein [Methylophilaceae bacterium]